VLEELYTYELPASAPPETARQLASFREELQLHLKSYREEAAKLRAARREKLLSHVQQLRHLARTAQTIITGTPIAPPQPSAP